MTRNQILYQEHVEKKRSNQATEQLTAARDTEAARHNVVSEKETQRHNTVTEGETERSNRAREIETNRSNLAREFETNRSNLTNEALRAAELSESMRTHKANESLTGANIQESIRSHLANEFETNRANLARESETNRSNLASEFEQNRHNVSNENLQSTANIMNYETSKYSADQRAAAAVITAETNRYLGELKEEGLNNRQIRQIGADALNVLHDDVANLLSNGVGRSTINRIIDDFILKEIRAGE